jgi:hypothetical protein
VLLALLSLESDATPDSNFEAMEVATLAATSEPARRLLTRITRMLCERLEHAR